jgi:hypothetical protein
MNVVAFPGTPPTAQQVLETVYRFNEARPSWRFDVLYSDQGQPFIEATHKLGGTALGFHWKPNNWAVTNENGRVLEEDISLDKLMATHLS